MHCSVEKRIAIASQSFERVFEISSVAFCVIGLDGKIRSANPATARLFGYALEELVGRSVFDLIHPGDRDAFGRELDALLSGDRMSSFENRFQRAGGEYRWLLWNATPLPEEECVFAIAQDITEQKTQQEERYRRLFETAKDGILIVDGPSGRILDANARAAEILGYAAHELTRVKLPDLEPFRHNDLGGDIVAALQERETLMREENIVAMDGKVRVCELLCNRYMEGESPRIQCNIRDVSERKSAERALTQSEERFRALVEGVRDYAIFMMDSSGTVISWNPGAERILGYKGEEILGRKASILFTPEDVAADQPEDELGRAESEGRAEDERWHVRKDGSRFFATGVVTSLWEPNGRLRGFAKVMRDITDRKNNEEAMREAQKLESIGLLAGGVAHDFNNLLTGIIGNASLALDDLASLHPARRKLEGVLAAGRRAADLTRQLLAYSGKGRFTIEAFNISDVVSEILELIQASIPERIKLELRLEPNPPAIEADPTQIQQVAMNLVINASEAIEGQGRIVITTAHRWVGPPELAAAGLQHLTPGDYVILEVQDNGEGMDEATRSKIFDPFFTTKFTGRGLGLAAVSGILRGHRGGIQVVSAPHQGSTFRVFLPSVNSTPAPRRVGPQVSASPSAVGTILVVDDDEFVRDISRDALERQGYHVLTARDGKESVELFEQRTDEIILVVLDMAMPVMSGEEAYRRFKAVRPKLPILVCSGYSESMATDRFGPTVVKAFIQKPYTSRELAEKVSAVLKAGASSGP